MDLYPWSFDSINSHCHDDVISILNILKEFWAIAHLRGVFKKKQVRARPRHNITNQYEL
jgi:hypothetical protein